jgi:allophanate hydrolase
MTPWLADCSGFHQFGREGRQLGWRTLCYRQPYVQPVPRMSAANDHPGTGLGIGALRRALLDDALSVEELIDRVLDQIAQYDDPALWITRVEPAAVRGRAQALAAAEKAEPGFVARMPLFGIPFAVKDNIDVAGLPTTAACPAFAYTPACSAAVVERLEAAGAILVGKTNLDQFATGLVGTRSPYGVPRNPFHRDYIPGGSSSGSAVAVAAGLVSFTLGTDTAGSGRVPAAFNNITGLKPTRGLVSTSGVVPACRSLDCVSIFAPTAADAAAVLKVATAFDAVEPLSRAAPAGIRTSFEPRFRVGVPAACELEFFGDHVAETLFAKAVATCEKTGGVAAEIRFAPFGAAGRLLYDGPWLAERLEAAGPLLDDNPEALLPVTRAIIERGRSYSALDAFRAQYELAALRREAERELAGVDCLLLPTAGTIYEIAAVLADPVRLNNNLGLYTNFANLLDLSALALPAGLRGNGLPFGVSLLAPAFAENALIDLGMRFETSMRDAAHRVAPPL